MYGRNKIRLICAPCTAFSFSLSPSAETSSVLTTIMFSRKSHPQPVAGFGNISGGKVVAVPSKGEKIIVAKAVMRAVLQAVVEVSDVFPPLKGVVVGMNIIVEYSEVRIYFI